MPNIHRRRRRDATVELSSVGVGGVCIGLRLLSNVRYGNAFQIMTHVRLGIERTDFVHVVQ